MPLPDSRETTYAAGSQVKSVDLNKLQDSIVQGSHPDYTIPLPAVDAEPGSGAARQQTDLANILQATGDAILAFIPLPVRVGEKLKSVKATVQPTVGTVSLKVWKLQKTAALTLTQLGSTQTSSGTTVQDLSVTGLTEVIAAGFSYYAILYTSTGAGNRHYHGGEMVVRGDLT